MRKLFEHNGPESNQHQIVGLQHEPDRVGGVGSRVAASHRGDRWGGENWPATSPLPKEMLFANIKMGTSET